MYKRKETIQYEKDGKKVTCTIKEVDDNLSEWCVVRIDCDGRSHGFKSYNGFEKTLKHFIEIRLIPD